jgi:hypothetical protein
VYRTYSHEIITARMINAFVLLLEVNEKYIGNVKITAHILGINKNSNR